MSICDQTFVNVQKYLEGMDYKGPLGLSCDDTKLFATFRLYWNLEKGAHFLIGGTDGPIQVANPESVKKAIVEAKERKATKVSNPTGYLIND